MRNATYALAKAFARVAAMAGDGLSYRMSRTSVSVMTLTVRGWRSALSGATVPSSSRAVAATAADSTSWRSVSRLGCWGTETADVGFWIGLTSTSAAPS